MKGASRPAEPTASRRFNDNRIPGANLDKFPMTQPDSFPLRFFQEIFSFFSAPSTVNAIGCVDPALGDDGDTCRP